MRSTMPNTGKSRTGIVFFEWCDCIHYTIFFLLVPNTKNLRYSDYQKCDLKITDIFFFKWCFWPMERVLFFFLHIAYIRYQTVFLTQFVFKKLRHSLF
jgi:hypothetical protein